MAKVLGAFIIIVLALSHEVVASEPLLLIYYEKLADDERVTRAIPEIRRSLEGAGHRVITAFPEANPYYDQRSLTTNAVVCGRATDPNDLKTVVTLLIQADVEILYIGPYPNIVVNSSQKTIDIRAVGDTQFYSDYLPINPSWVDWGAIECGVGPGIAFPRR